MTTPLLILSVLCCFMSVSFGYCGYKMMRIRGWNRKARDARNVSRSLDAGFISGETAQDLLNDIKESWPQ